MIYPFILANPGFFYAKQIKTSVINKDLILYFNE